MDDDYRSGYRQVAREVYWTLPRIVFFFVIAGVLIGGVGWTMSLLSQPGRVITKTFDADNIINNYEWFYDAYGNLQARTAQVKQFKALFETEKDGLERNRLRMEMAAIQQSCRDLARRYNANAEKANRSIFMGRGVPASFSAGECE